MQEQEPGLKTTVMRVVDDDPDCWDCPDSPTPVVPFWHERSLELEDRLAAEAGQTDEVGEEDKQA